MAHRNLKAATECLSILGWRAEMEPARVEAAILGDAALERDLSLPLHAYAIAAGEEAGTLKALAEPDRSWVAQPAPLRPFWGPLAAAMEAAQGSILSLKVAEALIQAGAPINAPTESPLLAEPAPLLAQRAIAGDAAGVRLLLLSGASPEALSQPFKLAQGGKGTALGLAALSGDEEMIRLLLSSGADPLAIPGAQLRQIGQERPEARLLLGQESWLGAFSRSAQNWGRRLAKAPSPPSTPATPAAETRPAGLDVGLALSLSLAAEAPPSATERLKALAQSARELSAHGSLPAEGADAMLLRRLWESNLPLFFKRFASVPPEHRDEPSAPGEPSAHELIEHTLDAAEAAMGAMRQRAVQAAKSRLLSEAAVISSGAESALGAFEGLVESREGPSHAAEPIASKIGPA